MPGGIQISYVSAKTYLLNVAVVNLRRSAGPVQYDVYPNFSVALDDPHILQCLTIGV